MLDVQSPIITPSPTETRSRPEDNVRHAYLELTRSIERLHRRFLDVLRSELIRVGMRDLNGVQALLLTNIGEEAIAIRDLVERGYYQGSNVSYNIKKLTEMGYLAQRRSPHDRRSVTVSPTKKALAVVDRIRELEERIAASLADHDLGDGEIDGICRALSRLEGVWANVLHHGRP